MNIFLMELPFRTNFKYQISNSIVYSNKIQISNFPSLPNEVKKDGTKRSGQQSFPSRYFEIRSCDLFAQNIGLRNHHSKKLFIQFISYKIRIEVL